jgi:hypothetical protein
LAKASICFGGPSKSFENNALVMPELGIVGILPDGLVESIDGVGRVTLIPDRNTFDVPGNGTLGIESDGFITCFDGFIIIAQIIVPFKT